MPLLGFQGEIEILLDEHWSLNAIAIRRDVDVEELAAFIREHLGRRTCRCGNLLPGTNPNRKYCSPECRKAATEKYTYTCAYCGKEDNTAREEQKFCSREHALAYRKEQ